MSKRKKKTNKLGKVWALVLLLVVAYFATQGDLSALNDLPSLSEVTSSQKETPSTPKATHQDSRNVKNHQCKKACCPSPHPLQNLKNNPNSDAI